MNSRLKAEIPHLVASLLTIPFLATWPFLSAFPLFSLMESTGIDLSTILNVFFLVTGFWSVAGGLSITSWLTDGRLRTVKSPNKMLVIGGYSAAWIVLYTAYAMWPTL